MVVGLLLIVLPRCGSAGGGIVDNGNKPSKEPDGQADDKSRFLPLTVSVLDQFLVSVPSPAWVATTQDDQTALVAADRRLEFRLVAERCEADLEHTENNIDIYWCEPTRTILAASKTLFVEARHPVLSAEEITLLRSFRRR